MEAKVCIAACPTNHTYNAGQLLCIADPVVVPNNTNNTNNTNNSNSNTTNNTTNPITQTGTSWVYRLVPNYLFAFVLIGGVLVLAVSKHQVPETNFKLCLLVFIGLSASASLGQALYF